MPTEDVLSWTPPEFRGLPYVFFVEIGLRPLRKTFLGLKAEKRPIKRIYTNLKGSSK